MIKSFSGRVIFCFAILRAISAYVCENGLSQYTARRRPIQMRPGTIIAQKVTDLKDLKWSRQNLCFMSTGERYIE